MGSVAFERPVVRAAPTNHARRSLPPAWLAVAGLTGLALGLRLVGLHASLTGDELFAYGDVHAHSLGSAISAVGNGVESSPPLFFIFAWAAAHLGDHIETIRLPSIVFGAAAVPITYALGRRTVGAAAGLLGAALLALNPLSLWQGSEGRPYEMLMFCTALSALVLLVALAAPRPWSRWWLVYTASAAAVVYVHYTGVFVLGVQTLWALWAVPARRRQVLAATVLAALLFVPWLPYYHGSYLQVYNLVGVPLRPGPVGASLLEALIGHPAFGSLSGFPGLPLTILFAAAVLTAAAVLASERPRRVSLGDRRALVVLLAAATPVGIVAYAAVSYDILLEHNLIASLPFALLTVAWLLTAAARRRRMLGALACLAVMGVAIDGAVRTISPGAQRADYRGALAYVNHTAAANDTVLDGSIIPALPAYQQLMPVYLSPKYALGTPGTAVAARGWQRALAGKGHVFLVVVKLGLLAHYRPPPFDGPKVGCSLARAGGPAPTGCVPLRSTRVFRGLQDIVVAAYAR